MSGSLGRAAAALLRWGRGAGRGLWSPGVRTAGSGAGGGGGSTEHLDAMVKKDKVVVFLKGTPEQPQCGFSNAVVQILRLHGVRDYAAYNVLDDPALRQGQSRGLPAGARGAAGGPGCGREGLGALGTGRFRSGARPAPRGGIGRFWASCHGLGLIAAVRPAGLSRGHSVCRERARSLAALVAGVRGPGWARALGSRWRI